jgi:hypothetical protein
VLEELQRQRGAAERARASARAVDDSAAASEGVLRRMGQWWRLW